MAISLTIIQLLPPCVPSKPSAFASRLLHVPNTWIYPLLARPGARNDAVELDSMLWAILFAVKPRGQILLEKLESVTSWRKATEQIFILRLVGGWCSHFVAFSRAAAEPSILARTTRLSPHCAVPITV